MKTRIKQGLLVALSLFVMTAPAVLAYSFRAPITVSNTSATSYTMLPVMVTVNNTYLAANGFLGSSGLDSRVETLGGVTKPHLIADNKTLFATVSAAGSQTNLNYTTGSSNLSAFDIITGYGGYVTITDSANQELASNFTKTYTNLYLYGSGNVDVKPLAYSFTRSSTNVTFEINQGVTNPVIAGNATTTVTPASAAWTVNLPAGIAVGDLLIVNIGMLQDRTVTFATSGWNQLYFTFNVNDKLGAWYKVADGTDGATVGVTLGGGTSVGGATAYRITGYSGTPESPATATGTSVNPDPPAITPTWGSNKNLYIAAESHNGADTPSAFPAGYSGNLTGAEGGVTIGVTTVSKAATSASDDPGTFTVVNSNWVAGTIAVKPTSVAVTVTGIVDGLYSTATVHSDSTNLWATVGSSASSNTTTVAVPDNANSVVLMSNATPYLGSYTLAVGGNQQVRYEPNAIIATTVLPDRGSDATSNPGAITWGANAANVTATIGALISSTQTVESETTTDPPSEYLPSTAAPDLSQGVDNTVPAALLANPLRPLVTMVSDPTTLTEIQVWRWYGAIFVLGIAALVLKATKGHLGIASITAGVAFGVLVAFSVFPWFTIPISVLCLVAGVLLERTPSYG